MGTAEEAIRRQRRQVESAAQWAEVQEAEATDNVIEQIYDRIPGALGTWAARGYADGELLTRVEYGKQKFGKVGLRETEVAGLKIAEEAEAIRGWMGLSYYIEYRWPDPSYYLLRTGEIAVDWDEPGLTKYKHGNSCTGDNRHVMVTDLYSGNIGHEGISGKKKFVDYLLTHLP